ncbi:TPA: DUF4258 domain-containing protein [Vibrio alginolyticus]|uniref:DUF4258 domain-containing protein n=1 Tax=Vibrio alginolyticus TaxID=663 RepID=UPI001A2DC980|nr:DUF4258 domain-containing protein [Vibrio alginolyticus]EGQ7650489.1 DUF4258 domain-containing protein [Vibrio alginolyticus]MBS9990841.1 DUF4258 domain-containing protein [Vibrio alginolyticus]MBT0078200.1 DUF4258 domain-containing protein [Vibrio alginolyticus]
MLENELQGIDEFPLTSASAKKVINELASNHTSRVFIGSHARERMEQRGVTRMQIFQVLFQVLGNKHSRITEAPHQTPRGDWKCNLQGMAAGEIVEVVVSLKRHEDDPSAFVVTVMVK